MQLRLQPGLRLAACLLLLACVAGRAHAAEPDLHAFLKTYCQECHGPEKQKADRRFDQVVLPVAKPETLIDLQDIVDELNLGEMPPKKAKQPSEAESAAVIASVTQQVSDGYARLASTGGHTVLRRLNRQEYLNTVGDLFGLNMLMFDPAARFPHDQIAQHFDKIGDALQTSSYLLQQYLEAAEQVVEKAFAQTERPPEKTWHFDGPYDLQPELRMVQVTTQGRYLFLFDSAGADKPEGAYVPIPGFESGAPYDGWYEIKVRSEALNRQNPYDPEIFGRDPEAPFRMGMVAGNAKTGLLHLPQPVQPVLTEEVTLKDNEPEYHTFRVWLDAGFTPRFTFPNGQIDTRATWGRLIKRYPGKFVIPPEMRVGIVEARHIVMSQGQMPQIRLSEVQVRGPICEQWPPPGQQALLGGAAFKPERTRELLERFANRAYRRAATREEVDRLCSIAQRRREQGVSPFIAYQDALKAALCSPAFIYLEEPETVQGQHRLSAEALAARLSYFLWSTTPDAELTRAAQDGSLQRPEVLLAQARRLLASPRAEEFVDGFLDGWLNLRALGDMAPDRDTFRRYYAEQLQPAMKRETQLFTRNLLDENGSLLRFIDADYTFANRALARLYGDPDAVPAATAGSFQKIALRDPQRGGLLGQGSILTVSANGVETSPVTRGVFLLDNILGTPPSPPPENVPPIDPDVRGATSMRDLLTRHRNNATCFECHRKIDPLGFALERFDPIGSARAAYEKGGPIDTSGELPGGQKFQNLAELKKILLERKDQFARTLADRILAYACGRAMEPLDRVETNRIVKELSARDYGLRTLVELVIASPTFQSK